MIILKNELFKAVVEHAKGELLKEACGILAGSKAEEKVVEKVYLCRNVDPSPSTAYTIGPKEQLEIMEAIDRSEMELIGFYHSHPSGPESPSDVDTARAMWPEYSYVILSLSPEPLITSWILKEGEGFVKEEVRIV